MAILTKQIPQWKEKGIAETARKIAESTTLGVVDIKGMPGSQFHDLRGKLRKYFEIQVIPRTVIKFAIEKSKEHKKNIEVLIDHLGEMPALIFSKKVDPFGISKLFQENKAPDFAKAGMIAPRDIEIEDGPTPFAPGPMLTELKNAGLKVKVEAGKIVIMTKSIIVNAGEVIKPNVADILIKLSIKPVEIGLSLAGAWENSFVFDRKTLDFDAEKYISDLTAAANMALNLSIGLAYPTKENISLLIGKAYREAKALGLEKGIVSAELLPELLAKATSEAAGLENYVKENPSA